MTDSKLPCSPLPWHTYITEEAEGIADATSTTVAEMACCNNSDVDAKLIVDSVNKVQQYREALEAIVKHQETLAVGNMDAHKFTGAWNIANKALEDK